MLMPDEDPRYFWSLGKFLTVFLVEMYAILICCRICIDMGYRGICIHICSKSQAAFLTLHRCTTLLLTLFGRITLLCLLAAGNRVILYWIPVHSSVYENEVIDEIARNRSSIPFVGPEPAIGTYSNFIKNMVFDLLRDKQYLN